MQKDSCSEWANNTIRNDGCFLGSVFPRNPSVVWKLGHCLSSINRQYCSLRCKGQIKKKYNSDGWKWWNTVVATQQKDCLKGAEVFAMRERIVKERDGSFDYTPNLNSGIIILQLFDTVQLYRIMLTTQLDRQPVGWTQFIGIWLDL